MANGKGALDCLYCHHLSDGICRYHEFKIPEGIFNRICCNFEANEMYWDANDQFSPPPRRFSWFRQDLKPGVLYLFGYNAPEIIDQTIVMRVPDYQNKCWRKLTE